jgi:Fic family protein
MKTDLSSKYPWLTFRINLREASPQFWINAGEAKSKCEHIAGVPLQPGTAKILHEVYVAKGVLATTAIEGNTLTEEEVRKYLDGRLKLPPSKEYLAKEVDNIVTACNVITGELLKGGDPKITSERIKKFNSMILEGLELEEGVVPGNIRTYRVTVGRYLAPPPEDCESLLSKLCEWIEGADFRTASGGNDLVVAMIRATVFHIYLAWIHPFGDGNGRAARLIEFQILLAAGVSTPAAHLLSNHYNLTRKRYYMELDRASKSGGDIIPFLEYALQGFVDGLREQLEFIRLQQMDVAWENYVHEQFSETPESPSTRRQCHLVLDLTHHVVAPGDVPELSPRLSKDYAQKTIRTIQRDVKALENLGLVERLPDGMISAKFDMMAAFLPDKKQNSVPSVALALENGSQLELL